MQLAARAPETWMERRKQRGGKSRKIKNYYSVIVSWPLRGRRGRRFGPGHRQQGERRAPTLPLCPAALIKQGKLPALKQRREEEERMAAGVLNAQQLYFLSSLSSAPLLSSPSPLPLEERGGGNPFHGAITEVIVREPSTSTLNRERWASRCSDAFS